jgi:CHAT domain-containing protein/tetratricopeptide (TPR) repeat protein
MFRNDSPTPGSEKEAWLQHSQEYCRKDSSIRFIAFMVDFESRQPGGYESMFRFLLLIGLSIPLMGYPSHSGASDWVFKGQPKDGIEHYRSSAAEEITRSQRLKLVADCDQTMQNLASSAKAKSSSDPRIIRSVMLGLSSCGLVYGVDHQKEKATECLNKSLELAISFRDTVEEARILNYLGIVHALWGQFPFALDNHRRSLSLSVGTADHANQAISYSQIGQIAMFMGDYRKASDAFKKSLALSAKNSEKIQTCLTSDNLGQLNEAWGDYDNALEYYRQALKLKTKLGLTGGEVASHVFLGRVYKRMGQDKQALESFQHGLKLCDKHGYPTDLVIDYIGNLYLDSGETQKAEEYIKRAGFWQSLGRLSLVTGDLSAAEGNYVKLLQYSEPRRMLDYLWVAHTGLGVIKEQKGDLLSAAEHFRGAIAKIESVRAGLTQPERAEFFNVQLGGFFRTAPYEGLARVLINMNKPSEAFRESEFAKARTFSEGLCRQSANTTMGVPDGVMTADAVLNQELAAATKALYKAFEQNDQKTILVLEPQVKSAKDKLAEHIAFIRASYPLLAATRYPEPMDLIHTALQDNEWVLVYDVTDTGIITYLVKGKKIVKAVFKPVARTEVDSLVRKFRGPLEIEAGGPPLEKLHGFNFSDGKKLSDILLHGVLADIPRDVHLIVVPDDSLGVLPFEALVLNDGGRVETDGAVPIISGAEFLGDRNPISYYQSVTALTLARTLRRQQKLSDRLLAMVDPVFSNDDPRLVQISGQENQKLLATLTSQLLMSIGKQTGITFPRLPLTGELGEDLKKRDPSRTDLYEGLRARKRVLLEMDLTAYGSVVFATHGYFGKAFPSIQEPVLVFTLLDDKDGEDGFLRLSEVMGLKMNCDIAALTACQTGLGRQVSGEGTTGMGRAFQYAGAKSVLMSLWSVAEISSVRLVESFFRHLKAGKKKPEALNLARNEIRKAGYDHPFFWAAFILVGEAD